MAQNNSQPQTQQLQDKHAVFKVHIKLAQLAPVAQHQQAQAVEFRIGEARRIDVVQNIGTVLVIVTVRNLAADFVKLRSPVELALEAVGFGLWQGGSCHQEKMARHPTDPLSLCGIGIEFPCDALNGGGPQIGQLLLAVKQVVQQTVPQGALGCLHLFDAKELENCPEHANAAANHRASVVFHAVEF